MTISRRQFIKGSLSAAVAAGMPFALGRPALAALVERTDRPWEDGYRNIFQGERVVRSINMPNCTGSCAWNVFIKDGIVQRVEQPLRRRRTKRETGEGSRAEPECEGPERSL